MTDGRVMSSELLRVEKVTQCSEHEANREDYNWGPGFSETERNPMAPIQILNSVAEEPEARGLSKVTQPTMAENSSMGQTWGDIWISLKSLIGP